MKQFKISLDWLHVPIQKQQMCTVIKPEGNIYHILCVRVCMCAPSDPEGVLQKGSWRAANPKRSDSSCFSSQQPGRLSWADHVSCCSTCDLWTRVGLFGVWQRP